MFELTVLVGVLVAIGLGIWGMSRHFRRRRALGSLALHLRMRFSPHDRLGVWEQLRGAYLMQLGHSGRAYNILVGKRQGRRLLAFDYAYEVGAGQSRSTQERSVVAWQVAAPAGEALGLRSGHFAPLGAYQNYEQVPAEKAGLRDRWRVYTSEPSAAQAWAGWRLERALRGCGAVNWQSLDEWVLFYAEGLLPPAALARLIARTTRLRFEKGQ